MTALEALLPPTSPAAGADKCTTTNTPSKLALECCRIVSAFTARSFSFSFVLGFGLLGDRAREAFGSDMEVNVIENQEGEREGVRDRVTAESHCDAGLDSDQTEHA